MLEKDEKFFKIKNVKKCQCNKILSVDDEIFNQKSLELILKRLGYQVIAAFNGLEAIEFIKKEKGCGKNCDIFCLILMDC